MSKLKFTNMAGAGNDFVVFDNRDGRIPEERTAFVRRVCARRLGVGADGALFVERSEPADFRMRYYNADGGEAEISGNGTKVGVWKQTGEINYNILKNFYIHTCLIDKQTSYHLKKCIRIQ